MVNPRSDQEVFDFVYASLKKQGCRSADENGVCEYRNKDGMKCAAGFLIPDEDYTREFEGVAVRFDEDDRHVNESCLISQYFSERGYNLRLIECLQNAHDNVIKDSAFTATLNQAFSQIAKRFNLVFEADNE